MLHNPCILEDTQTKGTKSELAQKWAKMLHNTCILGEPQTKGDKITNGPASGWKCYISAAFSRIPKKKGTKSELAHKWAEMLHNPCILGDPQIKEDTIRIGPQVDGIAT